MSFISVTFFSGNKQLEQLHTTAQEQHKNIVIYFSGSDWCMHCHYFDKYILAQDTVQALLTQNYIQYTADFPQRKKIPETEQETNALLAEHLNPEGVFPSLVITDEDFNIKVRMGRETPLPEVIRTLQQYTKSR